MQWESLCNYLLFNRAGDNDSEDQLLSSKDVLEESQLQDKNRFYKLGWFKSRSDAQP